MSHEIKTNCRFRNITSVRILTDDKILFDINSLNSSFDHVTECVHDFGDRVHENQPLQRRVIRMREKLIKMKIKNQFLYTFL